MVSRARRVVVSQMVCRWSAVTVDAVGRLLSHQLQSRKVRSVYIHSVHIQRILIVTIAFAAVPHTLRRIEGWSGGLGPCKLQGSFASKLQRK